MWELRTGQPLVVYGHLIVVVKNTHPLHRYYGKKLYLCLHCLRLSRKYGLFYNRLCEPSDGSRGCGCSYLGKKAKMSPGLRELVMGGRVVEKNESSTHTERKRPAHGWPTPTTMGNGDD